MKTNEIAFEYCREYVESETPPGFAILLRGEWGCGKTYFANKLIEYYQDGTKPIKENHIMYLSVFGVSSLKEIDCKIYEKLHPILSSKVVKNTCALLNSAIRVTARVDLNLDGKDDATIQWGGNKKDTNPVKISKLEKKLIIVDDIERANISISEIFGYFSDYLYQNNLKIIYIGNEDRIEDISSDETKKYKLIKEKSIGIEFLIKPDLDDAVNYFIDNLIKYPKTRAIIHEELSKVIKTLKCNNLRIVRQSVYNLNLFLIQIIEFLEPSDTPSIIRTFLQLYIQKNNNSLEITGDETEKYEESEKAIMVFEDHQMSYIDFTRKQERLDERDRMLNYFYTITVPLNKTWFDIIFNNNYNKTYIEKEYKKELELRNPSIRNNLIKLLNSWLDLESSQFKKLLNKVIKDFENNKYRHPGEIYQYFSLLEHFIDKNLINSFPLYKNTIKIIKKHQDDIILLSWHEFRTEVDHYGGHSFSKKSKHNIKLYEYLKEINREKNNDSLFNNINQRIQKIPENFYEFCNILSENGDYIKLPILSRIDINVFFNKIIKLQAVNQYDIIRALDKRYNENLNDDTKLIYIKDLSNIKKLRLLYKNKIKKILYSPHNLVSNEMVKSLDEIIKRIQLINKKTKIV